jgi:hypothetical protein
MVESNKIALGTEPRFFVERHVWDDGRDGVLENALYTSGCLGIEGEEGSAEGVRNAM